MGRGREAEAKETELLHPADIEEILEKYGHLLKSYQNLHDRESVFANYRRTTKRLEVLFPLIEHPIHGITGIHAVENYNEAGYVSLYQYHWKIIIPKMGIQSNHISGWGNEPFSDPLDHSGWCGSVATLYSSAVHYVTITHQVVNTVR
ncbi:hypothetical protein CU633_22065 [Bacillus sp. V3-13]|uniref:hypothetical protein n=1 Tax=Bacillus sp. V3-13 TaxID=2053728 RepID=UPI000C759EFD|nr:hypothetical protein [Bacillus sp. V3-13]PLR75267.1 hypothetical protein CU633_22065 [Bacillus sp. V3-13]